MEKKWQFSTQKDRLFERAFGRDHFWHHHPDLLESAESFMVKVIVPHGSGHDFHIHPKMHEILYVLEGRAEQWVEDEVLFLDPGDSVYIDAAVPHATFNAGEGELAFLAILSPPEGWEAGTVDVSDQEPYASYRRTPKK